MSRAWIGWALFVVVLLAWSLSLISAPRAVAQDAQPKWEYKAIQIEEIYNGESLEQDWKKTEDFRISDRAPMTKALNELAGEGWEIHEVMGTVLVIRRRAPR